jgi:nucleoid DNA-binding protein
MAERLFEEVGLNKREAKEFVDSFFDTMRDALERGEQVKLSGFGNFDLRQKNQRPAATRRPARRSRSPHGAWSRSVRARSSRCGSRRMLDQGSNNELPPIPAKRYFTIGEVSELCAVKPHVLRYWEQEFTSLKPVKRSRQSVRSLLPAPRRADDPPDPFAAVRPGLHHRRRAPAP